MRKWRFILCSRARVYGVAFILAAILFMIGGVEYYQLWSLDNAPRGARVKPPGRVSIVVRLSGRVLEVYSDQTLYKKYPVAVGKAASPTPVGEWNVVYKEHSWRSVFGTRWMGLDVPWGSYGIHGTNMPWSIGDFASHGCVRMRNRDVEELYGWVSIGTPVTVVGPWTMAARPLRLNMAGPDVVTLQLKLKKIGYGEFKPTGVYGRETEEAVKRYQYDHKLKTSGEAGRETLERLGIWED